MKKQLIPSYFTVLFTASSYLLCSTPVIAENTGSTASVAFESVAQKLYQDILSLSPVNLHYYQADTTSLPIELTNPLGSFSEECEELSRILSDASVQLDAISFSDLTRHQKQVYHGIRDLISTQQELLALPDYAATLGPMSGMLSNVDTIITEYYLLTEEDVVQYLALLADLPRFLNDLLLELDYQTSIGFAPSSYVLGKALEREKELTTPDEHLYQTTFTEHLAECSLSDEQKQAYTIQAQDILQHQVIPAYQTFFASLRERQKTASAPTGLCTFENGLAYYDALCRNYTGTDMDSTALYEYLTEQVAEDLNQLSSLYMRNFSLFDEVETLSAPYSDPDEILSQLSEQTAALFPQINHSSYTLSYLPESLEVDNTLAYYISPPNDLPDRNIIRVNQSEIGEDSLLLWTTLAHEGFPGHLYQHQYFMDNIYEYPIESLLGSMGTSEGWAFYVERLSLDWINLDKDAADFYWLNNTISMGVSAIADLGIHAFGWDMEELGSYLSEYFGPMEQEDLIDLYDTIASDPGAYLPYAVGYYQICDLFDAIESRYSSPTDMYTAFLNFSNMPFTLLHQYLCTDDSL